MNDWTPNQIKELVKDEIASERRLRDELRKADHISLQQYKDGIQRALELAKSNADRLIAMSLSVIALVTSVATFLFVYLRGGNGLPH